MIGSGSWGTAVAVLLARGGLEVELGTRSDEKAAEIGKRRVNERYLPGVELPESVTVKRSSEIELAGCDLICLAVPSRALPNVVGALGDRIGSRASVLLLSKGLVQPMGALPNEYVSERVRCRAIACLGGTGSRPGGDRRDGGAGARQQRPRPADDARRGLRPRRAGLRAHGRRPRGRGRRRGQERRRARRRRRRAARAQRRRDRHRRDLARMRGVRAGQGRTPGDLLRARRASAT